MLWTVLILLLTLWLLGLIWHVGGLIHLVLVVAFVVFLVELFSGRRAAL
ncbi:MAG: lmo0937 family membrane protein [Blastocatellia bacterium]